MNSMGTNCVPLVADLFLFCFEMDFMKSLTKEKRYDLINFWPTLFLLNVSTALKGTHNYIFISSYLDDLLNIDNIHFENMVHIIYDKTR